MKKGSKIKLLFDKVKYYSKKYASTNKLFMTYVILMVLMGCLLRGLTVGFRYSFLLKPILSDFMIALIFGSFGYLFRPKNQFKYFFSCLFIACALSVANTIYYEFFKSFLSVNLISTASMMGEVNDSILDKLNLGQFIYILLLAAIIYVHSKLSKRNYYYEVEKVEKGKKMFTYTLCASGVIALILFFTLNSTEISRLVKQWNREYIVEKYGLYVYTINDLVQSVQPKLDTLFGYDEAAKEFREYYSCKWENSTESKNKYTNIFKDKNVIFIHMESIQDFLVDLEINGEEVTPNINRLASEGIYFSNFYPQQSVGTSSDTEFTLSTGLMPSSSGTVFVNYYNRQYDSIQKYFNNMGYYTFSMHANNADYWNRKTMHTNLGYQDFYAKDSYAIPSEDDPEYIGLGLSDKSFFNQIIPILKNIQTNNEKYFGTVITLTNHSPYKGGSEVSTFEVTMDYNYIDESGNLIEETANYLEGTSMGTYIKSANYADEALGQLFDSLEENGLLEDTVFVLYGDHESRLAKKQFNLLYNYDPTTDSVLDEVDPNYYSLDNYNYELLRKTPLIIWTADKEYNTEVTDVMGMYDVLPTIANMFGFTAKYALGNDIFSNNEKMVVFPNGNILTNKLYYDSSNDDYRVFNDEVIDVDYLDKLKEQATEILEVSQGIITHDLIKNEADKIGECNEEK